jgi:hypothetical protein
VAGRCHDGIHDTHRGRDGAHRLIDLGSGVPRDANEPVESKRTPGFGRGFLFVGLFVCSHFINERRIIVVRARAIHTL